MTLRAALAFLLFSPQRLREHASSSMLETRLRRLLRLLLPLLCAAGVAGAEHAYDLPLQDGSQLTIALGAQELSHAGTLHVVFHRDTPSHASGRSLATLELVLVTVDRRFFSIADPIQVDEDDGEAQIPLDGAHWGSEGGMLGEDAIGAMSSILLRMHSDESQGHLTGTLTATEADADMPTAVALTDGGLIDRGPWRELAVRLLGSRDVEIGDLELVDGARRWPLFLDQPGRVRGGHYQAVGPARWVLRLRPNEVPSGTLHWSYADRSWDSQPLPALPLVRSQPLPPAPREALPVPVTATWSGRPWLELGGSGSLLERTTLDPCLAPILSWNAGWTGFRGAERVAWIQALAIDERLAAGCQDIDLCPQGMLEEHGIFRFGLSPWSFAQGGAWRSERDAWTVESPWSDWRHHVRTMLARARATPTLMRWRLGVTTEATGGDELAHLHHFLGECASMVDHLDGRPLLIEHPQAVVFSFDDAKVPGNTSNCWFSFEDGLEDWSAGPLPITAALSRCTTSATNGVASLEIPLALGGGSSGDGIGGAFVVVDSNFFNLDQMQFDAQIVGNGSCQLYLWATDEFHHWYQQRLSLLPGDGRWRSVIADFSDDAPWEAGSPGTHWGAEVRRRIRRIGILGFFHGGRATVTTPAPSTGPAASTGPAPSSGPPPPVLRIDRVARYGWPTDPVPNLAFTQQSPPAPSVPLYEPISCDFQLNVPVRNPYDPDSADITGELEGPGGLHASWPAYWSEPMRLDFAKGVETAVPAGDGGWHWRYAPAVPGAWRWRLHAAVHWRDRTLTADGPWNTLTVQQASEEVMPPMRVSLRDPTWFETLDGAFFYPLGMNLRSPGDTRQVGLTSQVPRPNPLGDPGDIQRALAIGNRQEEAEWERMGTRAYERWFKRMHDSGMNWARVWMCSWWCGLEWTRDWDGFGGLTWYNQASAACLDRVMELARQQHVYVQIELMNHGAAGESADREWENSPYNASNGGMCATASEYFSSDEAFKTQAKRYRYTLARWGWQSHLAAWVLTSEVEWTAAWGEETRGNEDGGRSPSTEKWVRSSLDWFKAHDAWARPVSVHFSHPWNGTTLWDMPGLGFGNSNAYTGFQTMGWNNRLGGNGSQRDLPMALDIYLEQHLPPWKYHRPTLIGEWGGHWETNDARTVAQELHNGLWLQAVMPYAGDTGFWWWLWVDCADKWSEYQRVAGFLKGDDRRGLAWQVAKPTIQGRTDASIMGSSSMTQMRLYAWLTRSDQQADMTSNVTGGAAMLESGTAGSHWRCERWSCAEGRCEAVTELVADHLGVLTLPLGLLQPDAAFRLALIHQP